MQKEPEVLPFPLQPSLVRTGFFLDVEVKNTKNTSQFGPLADIAPNLFQGIYFDKCVKCLQVPKGPLLPAKLVLEGDGCTNRCS